MKSPVVFGHVSAILFARSQQHSVVRVALIEIIKLFRSRTHPYTAPLLSLGKNTLCKYREEQGESWDSDSQWVPLFAGDSGCPLATTGPTLPKQLASLLRFPSKQDLI